MNNKKNILIIGISMLILAVIVLVLWFSLFPSSSVNHSHNMIVSSEEEFIFEMVPHHQEAVDTARFINEQAENEELRVLTQHIIDKQTQEIAMLNQWKNQWYPHSKYVSYYKPMMPNLAFVSDPDKAFLEGMILHHEMAIMMAQQVLTLNPRAEVASFAQAVIDAQTSEVEQMQTMLGSSAHASH